MGLRSLAVFLPLIVAADAFAQGTPPGNAACDPKTVNALFTDYCGADDDNSALCGGPLALTGQAAKLMVVADYCALKASAPQWCECLSVITTPKILAFDHVDERWAPRGQHEPERPASTFWFENETVRGTPRVRIGRKEELAVVLSRTNPLIFAAILGAPEAADVAELSAAKALLSAAGGALATGLTGAAALPGILNTANALDTAPRAVSPVDAAVNELRLLLTEWSGQVTEMSAAADGVTLQWNEVASAVQALETRRASATANASQSFASLDTAIDVVYVPELAKWTDRLRTLADLHAKLESCAIDATTAVTDYETLLKSMKLTPVCPLQLWKRELWDKTLWSAEAIKTTAGLLLALNDARMALAGVFGRKEPLTALVANLLETLGRLTRYGVRSEPLTPKTFIATWNAIAAGKAYTMHLGTHLIVAEEAMAGRWDHTQTYPVAISRVKGPLASIISPLRADLAPKYRVEQKAWSTIGFSVGVLARSTAEVRTWEKAGPENARYVRRANSTQRAGKIAAFVNYRFIESAAPQASEWWVRPGVEFGIATDGTNPGVLLGVSFEVGRVLRLGWGTSWFVLPELDGMTENGAIAEDVSIRTRSTFKGGLPYVSVTFALDSLSLFSNSK